MIRDTPLDALLESGDSEDGSGSDGGDRHADSEDEERGPLEAPDSDDEFAGSGEVVGGGAEFAGSGDGVKRWALKAPATASRFDVDERALSAARCLCLKLVQRRLRVVPRRCPISRSFGLGSCAQAGALQPARCLQALRAAASRRPHLFSSTSCPSR